jgi:hypothetical protein
MSGVETQLTPVTAGACGTVAPPLELCADATPGSASSASVVPAMALRTTRRGTLVLPPLSRLRG